MKAACAREKILKKDLCEKLDNMVSYVDFIEERSPQIIVEYRARLEEKLRELLADNQLDDSRIARKSLFLRTRSVWMRRQSGSKAISFP